MDETLRKAGDVISLLATKHVVENVGGTKAQIIVVELKGKPATAPAAK